MMTKNVARISTFALMLLAGISVLADSAAGVTWTMPAGWKKEAERPMRAATYSIAPAAGDTAPAECVVNFFGAGQGGSVADNLERWKSQFQGADGKASPSQVATRTVRTLKVTTIDIAGNYSAMGAPRPLPNHRLLGAIVEGPGGTIFFKLAGPAKTIAANQAKFEQLLGSLQKN